MLHSRMRWLIAAVALVVMLATTLLAGPALHSTLAASNRPQEYLALGNSVAFGYNPLLVPGSAGNPDNFIGYPNTVATALKEALTNASCPGETSSHFISLSGIDHGCGAYRSSFPLHVVPPYSTSQLAFTDGFLQSHPMTLVVSIDIGANDLFVLTDGCANSANVSGCILAGLPGMLATLSTNLDTIYGHIRNTDGYNHKLVALTYYSLNYKSDPADAFGTFLITQVNQVVAARTLAWKGVVADGFGAFAAASTAFGGDTCAAGLRIVLIPPANPPCDIHPSPAGRDLLAQAIVNALRPD